MRSKNDPRNIKQWEKDFIYLTYPMEFTKDIAKILNKSCVAIKHIAERNGWKKRSYINIGDIFYNLKVLSFDGTKDRSKKHTGQTQHYWKCICKCGIETSVSTASLRNGHTKSCGCYHRNRLKHAGKFITGTFICRVKAGAKKRNIKFDLTTEFLDNLFQKQNFKCAISGLDLYIPTGHQNKTNRKILNTASLDRIDSKKGYIEDNVQFVHKYINIAKSNLSQIDFINLCKIVAEHNK